jgi:IS4 transposase
VLHASAAVRDRVMRLGRYRSNPCHHPVRVVEVRIGGQWRAHVTNVLDPAVLSVVDVVERSGRRWTIEEAFLVTKRLLGLRYLWSGADNALALQVWATWLLDAVLVDLTDAVAEEQGLSLDALSLEMTFRGRYHVTGAVARGEASDPVAYLASQEDLDIVKRRWPERERHRAALDTSRKELHV